MTRSNSIQESSTNQSSAPNVRDAWRNLPKVESGGDEPLPVWALTLAPLLPRTTAAMLELDRVQRAASPLPPDLRARMRWIAASANRNPYGMAYAKADLRRAGASDDDLDRLTDDPNDWPAKDRSALRFARKLTLEAFKILDEDVTELRENYGDAAVVAMVQLLAYSNFQDRLTHSLGVQVENDGPLPSPAVRFAKPLTGSAPAPPRVPIKDRGGEYAVEQIDDQEWKRLDFSALQRQMESQRAREPRIPVPTFESLREKLPNAFPPGHELKIKWSLVCWGFQPELAQAWVQCTRTFAEEAKQDRVFEESLFWVVTRSLQCFY
jgi:alkylhydroperoxidase family enzyme